MPSPKTTPTADEAVAAAQQKLTVVQHATAAGAGTGIAGLLLLIFEQLVNHKGVPAAEIVSLIGAFIPALVTVLHLQGGVLTILKKILSTARALLGV